MDVTIYDNPGDQIILEQVKPDYSRGELIENPEPLYRMDDRGLRFYYTLDENFNPTFYGSTTSIKSMVTPTPRPIIEKELEMGKQAFNEYRNMKASFGTFWHLQAAIFTEHNEYDLDELQETIDGWAENENKNVNTSGWYKDAWKGLLSWMRFMADYNVKPLAIEIPLAHPDSYAGTIDLVCEMNAKKYSSKTDYEDRKRIMAIIDWKTGYIFPDHAIQLHMNKRCWEHNFPKMEIDAVYNWTWRDWRTKPSYDLRNQTKSDEQDLIDDYLRIWKTKHFSKPRDIRVSEGLLVVGNDANSHWDKIPISEYVKKKHIRMQGELQ